jgi:hypothetical protein
LKDDVAMDCGLVSRRLGITPAAGRRQAAAPRRHLRLDHRSPRLQHER